MQQAIALAQQAAKEGEVPVGAVLVKDGEIVGKLTTDSYEYEGVDPRSVGKDCGWSD